MAKVTPKGAPRIREGGAVREVLDRIGDKWSLLVVGTLRAGPLRFGALEEGIAGISQRMLTLTLKHLVEDGLVTRTAYAEVPPRVEYALTAKGRALLPIIDDMRAYGEDWLGAECAERGRSDLGHEELAVV